MQAYVEVNSILPRTFYSEDSISVRSAAIRRL
jgi:hypothetical protein